MQFDSQLAIAGLPAKSEKVVGALKCTQLFELSFWLEIRAYEIRGKNKETKNESKDCLFVNALRRSDSS